MLFNTTSATVTNACDLVYDRNAGTIALTWDSAAGSDQKVLASPVVLQNSQCQVGAVTAAASGLSQIITVALTFKGPFTGTKNIYMYGSDAGLNTGWVQRGTYLVAAGGLPVANSVVPGVGSGPAQRFSFTASDQGGSGFITGVAMLLSSSLSTTNACSMVYDRTANVVSLAFDNPANGATPVALGSSTVASNGQCTLERGQYHCGDRSHVDCGYGGPQLQCRLVWREKRLSAGVGNGRQFRLCPGGWMDRHGRSAHGRFGSAGLGIGHLTQFHVHGERLRLAFRTLQACPC